jgi:hypothetical protein
LEKEGRRQPPRFLRGGQRASRAPVHPDSDILDARRDDPDVRQFKRVDRELQESDSPPPGLDQGDRGVRPSDGDGDPRKASARPEIGQGGPGGDAHHGPKGVRHVPIPQSIPVSLRDHAEGDAPVRQQSLISLQEIELGRPQTLDPAWRVVFHVKRVA